MKVIETTSRFGEDGADSNIKLELVCDNGDKESVSFGEGEPEDMYLFRDLSDAYSLFRLVKIAYEAGKRGEEFIYEELTEED